jgi:hypothetical protein
LGEIWFFPDIDRQDVIVSNHILGFVRLGAGKCWFLRGCGRSVPGWWVLGLRSRGGLAQQSTGKGYCHQPGVHRAI